MDGTCAAVRAKLDQLELDDRAVAQREKQRPPIKAAWPIKCAARRAFPLPHALGSRVLGTVPPDSKAANDAALRERASLYLARQGTSYKAP